MGITIIIIVQRKIDAWWYLHRFGNLVLKVRVQDISNTYVYGTKKLGRSEKSKF